jgi:type I restriction enzyme R subunit
VTDPYLVNELRAKQAELDAALTPVAERLLVAFQKAKKAFQAAGDDAQAAKKAKDEMDALVLFKGDIAAYVRLYGFLSQTFDYGNTDIEKRAIFFKLLHPLLNFGREREGVDLSALRLTAYTIKDMGAPKLNLGVGERVPIYPSGEVGSGQVQDKQKALLAELIAKVTG